MSTHLKVFAGCFVAAMLIAIVAAYTANQGKSMARWDRRVYALMLVGLGAAVVGGFYDRRYNKKAT